MEIGPYFQLNSANNFSSNRSVVDSNRVTSWKNIRGSRDVKKTISTNHSPGERLEEHKQWCDYRRIILAWRFARALVYRAGPANPPVLQAIGSWFQFLT